MPADATPSAGLRRPALELRGITKRFGELVANEDIHLAVDPGEIHCLLGENGAGKSTLMKVAFGMLIPDAGEVVVGGTPQEFGGPLDAFAAGIGMVHQHFQLIPRFTVAENVALGAEHTRRGLLDLEATRVRIRELSAQYGLQTDPDALVAELSVGAQQRVELLKALFRQADVLILDEPTAVLTPGEVDEFFSVIHTLTDMGKAIVFITHKLREVTAIADRVTILRHGRVVGMADPKTATAQELASLMVGREVSLTLDVAAHEPGPVALAVHGLTVLDDRGQVAVDDLALEVCAGEIVGIAGVEGNGQTQLVEALTGLTRPERGTIEVAGRAVRQGSPKAIARAGVAHIPEDRHRFAVIESFSVADNIVLNRFEQAPFARRGLRQRGPIKERAAELTGRFDVRGPGVEATIGQLSGGNQQKVVVARELGEPRTVLVAAQPTRGLDVGSIEFIHRQIVRQRDEGAAVVVVSAELDEVIQLADRVGVMYRGRLQGRLYARGELDRGQIGLLMAGEVAAVEAALEDAAGAARTETR